MQHKRSVAKKNLDAHVSNPGCFEYTDREKIQICVYTYIQYIYKYIHFKCVCLCVCSEVQDQ